MASSKSNNDDLPTFGRSVTGMLSKDEQAVLAHSKEEADRLPGLGGGDGDAIPAQHCSHGSHGSHGSW